MSVTTPEGHKKVTVEKKKEGKENDRGPRASSNFPNFTEQATMADYTDGQLKSKTYLTTPLGNFSTFPLPRPHRAKPVPELR